MNGAIDFTRALTVDTLGLPSVDNQPADPAAARARAATLEVMRRDPPGQQMQDRFGQARLGYQNHVYLAINTLMDWMGAATFTVQSKAPKTVKKAMGGAGSVDSEWHPVPEEHPAAELFANPNDNQTFGDYVAQRTMCRQLFGLSYEWIVKDRGGLPREMYVLLPQYVTALPISPQYPFGALQLSVPQPMYGLNYAGYTRIDRRNVLIHRMPNPMFPWDGYSPLTAGGQMCDVLGSVIAARKKANDDGLSIDALVKLQGAGPDEVKRVSAKMKDRYSGIDRGDKYMVTNSDEIDVQQLSTTPDKMAFGESYKDSINFVLALFGVPPALAGLTEATSYAQLFAAIKQFCTGKLGAELRNTAQFWTQKLIRPAWPGCKGNYEPPSIEDDSTRPQTLLSGLQANAVLLNEYRAALNMKPMDGGDVTLAEWNQQFAPAQPAATPGQPGIPQSQPAPQGDPGDEDESAYPNQLMSHVMGAFGVDGSAQDDEQDQSADDTVLEDSDTPATMQKSLAVLFRKAKDSSGHEHKGKGPGGGQFGSGGGGGTADKAKSKPSKAADQIGNAFGNMRIRESHKNSTEESLKATGNVMGPDRNSTLGKAWAMVSQKFGNGPGVVDKYLAAYDVAIDGGNTPKSWNDALNQAFASPATAAPPSSSNVPAKGGRSNLTPENAEMVKRALAGKITAEELQAHLDGTGDKPTASPEAKTVKPVSAKPGKLAGQGRFRTEQDGTRTNLPDKNYDENGQTGRDAPANQADAHPAAVLAKQAAKAIPANLKPVAKIAVAKLKQSPIPATPLAHRQAANPQEWMPKVLAIAVPVLAKAMGLDAKSATALLTFGLAAALHQISKQPVPQAQAIPVAKPIPVATPIPVAKVVKNGSGRTPLPGTKPQATQGKNQYGRTPLPQPKNKAGKGSLPKRLGKSMESRAEVSAFFAKMLAEECPVCH